MTIEPRVAEHPIDPAFLSRWSPRAFDGSALAPTELLPLFEAARWAPSSFNVQPWRFLYAVSGGPDWETFVGFLLPFNQVWARRAGALVLVLSDTMMTPPQGGEPKPSHSHSFDAGSAWALLALQAQAQGLYTHGMTGVDFDAARAGLSVPDRFRIEAMIAIGRIGDPEVLPEQLRVREAPSPRRPIATSIAAGAFPRGW
ncbi:nitroreductase family protein [Sphingomonas sp.]|jgi:nitroreductase|uniref:nitroreductase family protein n=1 Tax=Sphingomonas sp. TaxID=28214 RepID=UPI002D81061F|nr:nitroreductase family protein [Sphingomonas sp.]HEU0044487.1 nitroreductase family protein [Sphingomonas sp.]